MIDRGVLICRVNSREDSNYGAVGHPEIESGLYNVRGVAKRFFSNDDIGNLFANGWTVRDLQLKTIDRYDLPKCIWEFTAIND